MTKASLSTEQKILCGLLRKARRAAGLRQVEVAERLSRPQAYVSRYERGESRVDLHEIRRICGALEVDLIDLVAEYLIGIREREAAPLQASLRESRASKEDAAQT